MLQAKDKGHSASILQKKGLQKSFLGDIQFIGVPRIFDWGRPKPQITCNNLIRIFPKRNFLGGQRYRRMEDLKSLPVGMQPGFCKERGLKLTAEKCKYLTLETC